MKIFSRIFLGFLLLTACTNQRAPSSGEAATGNEAFQGPFALTPENFGARQAKVYLPLQYESKAKWPLVILLHGFGGSADWVDTYLAMRFRVSSRGFILVTPDGTKVPAGTKVPGGPDYSGNQFWNATDYCCDLGKTGVDDVGYLTSLIEMAKVKYQVDPSRIYLFGHSNGGFMANRLACEEAGKGIAGIANLAGGGLKDPAKCRVPNAIPYLQIHAVNDPTILYGDDPKYAGAEAVLKQWVKKNGCGKPEAKEAGKDYLQLVPGEDTKERAWKSCKGGNEVALWTIKPFTVKDHHPHIPLFHPGAPDAVLDFLFRHSL